MANLIKTIYENTNYKIVKSENKNSAILGKFVALLSKADVVTQNGTYYPEQLWESVLNSSDFKKKLEKKLILGELDHPSTPDSSPARISHAVVKVWKEGKDIWGECEVFNTPNGQILWTLLNAGVSLGVSSRAVGDVEIREGKQIIKTEGFNLIGWDVVVNPSVVGAEIKSFNESYKRKVLDVFNKYGNEITNMIVESVKVNEKDDEERKYKKEAEILRKNLNDYIERYNELKEKYNELSNNYTIISKKYTEISEKYNGMKNNYEKMEVEYNKNKELVEKYKNKIQVLERELDNKNYEIKKLNENKVMYNIRIEESKKNDNDDSEFLRNYIKRRIPKNM